VIDFRPYGQRVTESAQYRALRESGFRGNTGPVDVGTFRRRPFAGEEYHGPTPEEVYTLIQTSALPSSPALIAPYRRPDIATPDMPELNVRDAFVNLQTNSNSIEFFRELLFTNAAAATAEGVAAPESALTFESTSVAVKRIAHYIPVTEIALDDEPRLRGLIEGRLVDGLRLVEDDELLNGDGTGEHLRGLLNVSGVQVLDAAHFAGEPVENAGNAWEDFDRIVRARREVRIVGRAKPNVVMVSPADLERFLTITDQNGMYFSGSPFSDIAILRMRGLLLIETEALDEGDSVVADGRQFEVYDRMVAAVTAGYINDDFVKGRIALLATERLAFAPIRPAAAAILTLTSAA
jgi:HK97 family phage major capsid protein